MISTVVPTYKQPRLLDILIRSFIENTTNLKDTQLIIVIDGTPVENEDIIKKYETVSNIRFVVLDKNYGMSYAQNLGVSIAAGNLILIINDDHVFPVGWDDELLKSYKFGEVTIFNTVQSKNTWKLKYTVIHDFGNSDSFDFYGYSRWTGGRIENIDPLDSGYAALPFCINKFQYISMGGFDSTFPHAIGSDCDFFVRCNFLGLKFNHNFIRPFFHFGSMTVNDNFLANDGKITRSDASRIMDGISAKKYGVNSPIHLYRTNTNVLFGPTPEDDLRRIEK